MNEIDDSKVEVNDILYPRPAKRLPLGLGVLLAALALVLASVVAAFL